MVTDAFRYTPTYMRITAVHMLVFNVYLGNSPIHIHNCHTLHFISSKNTKVSDKNFYFQLFSFGSMKTKLKQHYHNGRQCK